MLYDSNNMVLLGEMQPSLFNSVNTGTSRVLFLALVGSQWLECG